MTISITFSGTATGLGSEWTAYQTTGAEGYISALGHNLSNSTAIPAESTKSCGNYYNTQTSATDYDVQMTYDAATGLDGVTYYTLKTNAGTNGEGYYLSRNSGQFYFGVDGGTTWNDGTSTSGLGGGPLRLVRSGNTLTAYFGTTQVGSPQDVTGGLTGTRVVIEIYDGNGTTKANWTSGSITGEVTSAQAGRSRHQFAMRRS
jgi:hypothetical protein